MVSYTQQTDDSTIQTFTLLLTSTEDNDLAAALTEYCYSYERGGECQVSFSTFAAKNCAKLRFITVITISNVSLLKEYNKWFFFEA